MWTTALQIGQLVDTAQKIFDPTETRILVSHASPGREGILAQLSLVLKVLSHSYFPPLLSLPFLWLSPDLTHHTLHPTGRLHYFSRIALPLWYFLQRVWRSGRSGAVQEQTCELSKELHGHVGGHQVSCREQHQVNVSFGVSRLRFKRSYQRDC